MSIVVDPAALPLPRVLQIAPDVVAEFDEFTALGSAHLQEHLDDPSFSLSDAELPVLHSGEPPFGGPEAVTWADESWMLQFTESRLESADPYGIGVLFDGTNSCGIEDLSDASEA